MSNLAPRCRAQALQRLVAIAAASSEPDEYEATISDLFEVTAKGRSNDDGSDPYEDNIDLNEFEILVALCRGAPLLTDPERATALFQHLSPYLLEAHSQEFETSPHLRAVEPSPWDAFTCELTTASLALGLGHDRLHDAVLACHTSYLNNCLRQINKLRRPGSDTNDEEIEKTPYLVIVAASLLGFLEAVSAHADFYSVDEMLEVVRLLREILNEETMVSVEGTLSSIRTSDSSGEGFADWKLYTRRYANAGRPLGAVLLQNSFMRFLVSCSSLQICTPQQLHDTDVFEILDSHQESTSASRQHASTALVELMTELAAESMRLLQDGSDYLKLGSAYQQRLALSLKAFSIYTFLNCMVVDEETADVDVLLSWLEASLDDPLDMADDHLAVIVLKTMSTVARSSPAVASNFSRSLPNFIVQGGVSEDMVTVAALSLIKILRLLSSDAVITGLYSLGNLLTVGSSSERVPTAASLPNGTAEKPGLDNQLTEVSPYHSNGSSTSVGARAEEETLAIHANVVHAIVTIATNAQDEKVAALAQSMLLQKLGRMGLATDLCIIRETANLALASGDNEFKSLLKLYNRLSHDGVKAQDTATLDSVRSARMLIASSLAQDSPLYPIYLTHLLETIISKGDVHESQNSHQADVDFAAREIVELIPPLAVLVSVKTDKNEVSDDENVARLHREAWFNVVVHGITPSSKYGQRCERELRILAMHSRSLIAEERSDQFESEIELNTVLRRGMNPPHTAEQKQGLIRLLPKCESDIRGLSYPKVVFLSCTFLVETLRAGGGDCSHMLTYFLDPSLNGSAMENCMSAIADEVLAIYLRRILNGSDKANAAPLVAKQLASMFTGCCHRIIRVQQIATSLADRIINQVPSALCQRSSLFALLELLSIMWTSCLEAELDEYELKANYSSLRGQVSVELSDDYGLRRDTLNSLYRKAKVWVARVINIAPLDIKGLLQTYLSEFEDDGAYGHVALGRSFAVDMGAMIPAADQKLAAIDRHGDCNINAASDFIAQYTTRQEYKYADALPAYDQEWAKFLHMNGNAEKLMSHHQHSSHEEHALLTRLEQRAIEGKYIAIGELRDLLRRAAAVLCRTGEERCEIVEQLVSIPFSVFTKQSIKLGVSLWLGVIYENPCMEPTIMAYVAQAWQRSVRKRIGAFSPKLRHPDPFYLKEEFAPSDKAALTRSQQAAHNLIAPHLRVLQFLTSHFTANRLGNPQMQRIFQMLIRDTLRGLRHCTGHPLAREFHFQALLFGINVFRYCTGLSEGARWRLKDAIMSAGLAWSSHRPCWSFGGNRLQIKAEVRLMADVHRAVQSIQSFCNQDNGFMHSLTRKRQLLLLLLEDEQARLDVWLYPLEHERKHPFSSAGSEKGPSDELLSAVAPVAWSEDSRIAVQMTRRFASSVLSDEVRAMILKNPEKVVDEPDALDLLIGTSLPPNIDEQLEYLNYWKPVNPVTAITFFLPEYKNEPFIINYAMRALESHPVDVTFFYVPQIVQTLRYDVLGYVQRYIIETAKHSQLFAHQIIWNMRANAYKDEDSSVEDSLKPTLDVIQNRMIESFSETDRAFYEREFSFFGDITGISGKLRPFIKSSKMEKKQKIEEELRMIKLESGVYLPSNPDGTVIGIDRKSGKPLQSHAKAPFMATFRIKKNQGNLEATDEMLGNENLNVETDRTGPVTEQKTYEVWQSAIFKVGDDCRQDVLALQLIAAFRGIFNDVGLDVYVYPYRVTATAPGCGVIDVLPKSISRDMLGREAVNGLYDYFVSKYGAANSIRFQEARNNFVKSMAAYSVISYLLQFKDRHNGNIMVDDAGHILHIDFGFCFDIAPGGVRFERAPFKLTSEMVAVMGGDTNSQSYKWFEELCIKAFLASRQHTRKLCDIVTLMLGSGLPCFKPETILHLKQRFVLEKSGREAADFMRDLVKKSYGSYSTKGYDQFQLLTNGIPY